MACAKEKDNHLPAKSQAKFESKIYRKNIEFYSVWAPMPIDRSSNGPV